MEGLPPGTDPSQIPFAPNPSGAPPNFEGGESLTPTVLGTGVTFIIIAGLFVVSRVITGLKKSRKLFADDWLCMIGLIVGIAQWSCLYTSMSKGLGKHSWDVPITALTVEVMQIRLADQLLGSITHFAVKASLVFFFLRLFGTLTWVRVTCYGLLTLTFLAYGSYEVVVLAFCIPRPGEEWGNVVLARCATTAPATIAVNVCAVVADLALFIMPFPIIAGLTLSRPKKKGLLVVFLVGFLVVVTSVVGLVYRVRVSYYTIDPIWDGGNVAITAYMEVFGTVIVACTPALPGLWSNVLSESAFFSSLRSRILGSRSRRTGDSNVSGSMPTARTYPPPTFQNESISKTSFRTGSQRELVGEEDGMDEYPLKTIQKTMGVNVSRAEKQ